MAAPMPKAKKSAGGTASGHCGASSNIIFCAVDPHANGRSFLGVVLRFSELRRLGTVGTASTECRRLCGDVADRVRSLVALANKNGAAAFLPVPLDQI